jgi:hypothetical protein
VAPVSAAGFSQGHRPCREQIQHVRVSTTAEKMPFGPLHLFDVGQGVSVRQSAPPGVSAHVGTGLACGSAGNGRGGAIFGAAEGGFARALLESSFLLAVAWRFVRKARIPTSSGDIIGSRPVPKPSP